MQGTLVRFLVEELRSHTAWHGQKKKKKWNPNRKYPEMEFLCISSQATSQGFPKCGHKMPSLLAFGHWDQKMQYIASWIPVFYSTGKKKKRCDPFWPSKSSWTVYECQGHPWLCRWSKNSPLSGKIVRWNQGCPSRQQAQRPALSPVTQSQHGPTSKPASFLSLTCWTASPFTARPQAAQELEAPALKDVHPQHSFLLCPRV